MTNNASPEGEKIIEGNRLIAEFLGLTYRSDTGDGEEGYLFPRNGNFGRRLMPRWMQYHSSWDWLKPVVDKIFTYSLAHKDQTERLRKTSIVVDIIPCWQICVDFITWYNQQTPSNGK